ncbi:MAG: hypothetical protein M3450_18105 [Actinomycetota bacterium]|nr:hypothetical protein [Actinomycetota bacterium]
MGLIDKIKGELVDLIEWIDDSTVDAVEAAVAALAESPQQAPERSRLDQALTEVQNRVAVLEQGRLTEPGV